MIPGFGKFDAKKMQGMMKQLGINSQDIDAERVIIEKSDGRIVIENPNVQKIIMQGQESWQVTGDSREEESGIREEDVLLVMEKTGCSKEDARKTLEENGGDIAEAILKLNE